jgi:predicted PurR-regulated permease PerM
MPFTQPTTPSLPPPNAPVRGRGLSILLTAAAIVVVAAGVREAAAIISPILAAAFISMIAILPLALLQGKLGAPRWLALLIVLALTLGGALGIGFYLNQSIAQLTPMLPEYQARVDALLLSGLEAIRARGVDLDVERIMTAAHSWKLRDFADVIIVGLAKTLQNLVFVLLVTAFIIAEASSVPEKLRIAFPNAMQGPGLGGVADKVRSFLVVITQLNVVLAVINYAACLVLDVPFPFLLSFLVFFLNYIPTIGAIAASAVVVLITLITHGWGAAIGMAVVQALSGVVIGSVLQPKLLGSRLGLSPLVVLLSLVVWGYLLGIAGMFFAVPLTIIVKIVLDQTDDLRSLSVLLGDIASARAMEKRSG